MQKPETILASLAMAASVLLFLAAGRLFLAGREETHVPAAVDISGEEEGPYAVIPDDMELLKTYMDYNPDVVGILRIPGSVLNHPVVWTPEEEEYYLLRGLDGNYNSHGVPFLSAKSSMEGGGKNRIIYGHNIHKISRDVFCDLAGYEDVEYYRTHPLAETVSASGTRQWLIFAYFITDNADEDAFRYSDTVDFCSGQEFDLYMGKVAERNWLSVPVTCTAEDDYLTLSSCSNELSGSGTNRMVVMARGIAYGEDISGIVEQAEAAESPLLPAKLRD